MMSRLPQNARAFLLLAPLLLFLGCFFVWPLATMMSQAISDTAVLRILPRTAEASADWERGSPPTPEMKSAIVADLREANDTQAVGDMVRRLNSAQSGFRTLMSKTLSAIRDNDRPPELSAIDPRWEKPQFWLAIVDALSPVTDRNLLAAVDLTRDASGGVVAMSEGTSANRAIMLRTFWIASLVTLACAAIGFPYAMLAAATEGWKRNLLLAAVLLPLWTSLLVRTAAWFIILQENGLINDLLRAVGLADSPIPLIFNRTGVVIAMTHVLLPFMVLPIYSVLITIPKNLMPAAASLGANPLRAFLRVLLPLSFRGLGSGALLVFMSAIGYYITPALIGGPSDQMISSVIAFYATGSANWGMAGALGLVLLVATLMLYAVYGRLSAEDARRS
ncbi:ABC transporter permease [Sinorhizobium alkalisoli]|uniref:ABC transporter permease n=1 Tax=Sinorhizobium alkalisoli TaxID=1752398 RepID=A0A1E3VD19_9HYPH|nr:ABC transporter permease [Sinorhizobium alkalisoli]MCG5479300.1 ABC transporter permease [Sinorhizobium alkalisoli]ODR91483.1 ABC transporter permease [Sinorhizobium alkalisoli]